VLRSAGDAAAAVDAPSLLLSAAEQAAAHPVAAPRGRLEQYLLDLGVRDAGLLRQGVELDKRAQQILAQAHRPHEPIGPQSDVKAAPGPDVTDVAAETVWRAEVTADEPEADDGLEIGPG
jgi:hypothetical protein